jgi:hypothetical protein
VSKQRVRVELQEWMSATHQHDEIEVQMDLQIILGSQAAVTQSTMRWRRRAAWIDSRWFTRRHTAPDRLKPDYVPISAVAPPVGPAEV